LSLIIVTPLSLIEDTEKLSITSLFGQIANQLLILISLIAAFDFENLETINSRKTTHGQVFVGWQQTKTVHFWFNPGYFVIACNNLGFALTGHANAANYYSAMKNRKDFKKAVIITYSIIAVMFFVSSFFGRLAFYGTDHIGKDDKELVTEQIHLLHSGDYIGHICFIINIFLMFSSSFAFPLQMIAIRQATIDIIGIYSISLRELAESTVGRKMISIFTLALVSVFVIILLMRESNIVFILYNIAQATSGCALVFAFPALLNQETAKREHRTLTLIEKMMGAASIFTAVVLCPAGMQQGIAGLYKIFQSEKTVSSS